MVYCEVQSLAELAENGLIPNSAGCENARDYRKLSDLNHNSVLHKPYDTLVSLKLLFRRLAAAAYPRRLLSIILACYCLCRRIAGKAVKRFVSRGTTSISLEVYNHVVDTEMIGRDLRCGGSVLRHDRLRQGRLRHRVCTRVCTS